MSSKQQVPAFQNEVLLFWLPNSTIKPTWEVLKVCRKNWKLDHVHFQDLVICLWHFTEVILSLLLGESNISCNVHQQTTLLYKLAPLTWPGAPESSCSGRAGCRKVTGSLPTSSSPPSPPCSPPPCWQSRRGQSSSPSGSSCGWMEGWERERGRQTKPWVMKSKGTARWLGFLFFFFCQATLCVVLSCQEEDMGPHPNTQHYLPPLGCCPSGCTEGEQLPL